MNYRLEDVNIATDRRTLSAPAGGVSDVDEKKQTLALTVDEVARVIPFRWSVCPTCSGRGCYVNPSIDAGGLTREDFDDDPDFRAAYFGGAYDVKCNECKGRRVVPEPNARTPEDVAHVQAWRDEKDADARFEAEWAREQAMGY